MSSSEFQYWISYYSLHPFGSERDNIHSSMIATTIANSNRSQTQAPIQVEDFMLKSEREKKHTEARELMAYFDSVAVKK